MVDRGDALSRTETKQWRSRNHETPAMKHPSSEELFAHWRDRRGARMAPERGDIDPGAIRKALGDAFLLGLDTETDPAFRLAGTRVCALFCRELKGETFLTLWDNEDRGAVRDLLAVVSEEMIGLVAGIDARTREGLRADLELLLLPLRHRGRRQLRMIGTLAPLEPPFWLGSAPVERMQLRAWRHLGPAAEANRLPRLVPGSRRHGLIVHDGDLS
jgi:hypothetical protein